MISVPYIFPLVLLGWLTSLTVAACFELYWNKTLVPLKLCAWARSVGAYTWS